METGSLPLSLRVYVLEEEITRVLQLTKQTSKVTIKQTGGMQAISETLKEIGKVLKDLNEKQKGMEHQIKWLEARSVRTGGPLE